jgi:hypothetical protein
LEKLSRDFILTQENFSFEIFRFPVSMTMLTGGNASIKFTHSYPPSCKSKSLTTTITGSLNVVVNEMSLKLKMGNLNVLCNLFDN